MADAYPMLVAALVLALALAGLRATVGLLRRNPGPPRVGDRFLRDLAWVLLLAAAILLGECVLLLLFDCSYRDCEHEFAWRPSVRHAAAITHRLLLALGPGLGAFMLWSERQRARSRRPFTALLAAFQEGGKPPPGVTVIVALLLLAALGCVLTSLDAVSVVWSGWHWEALSRGRGLPGDELFRLAQPLVLLPLAYAFARLAAGLRARARVAWGVTLGLALVLFLMAGAATAFYAHRALTVQRSSISMGIPELAALGYAAPALGALWAAGYLFLRRALFLG